LSSERSSPQLGHFIMLWEQLLHSLSKEDRLLCYQPLCYNCLYLAVKILLQRWKRVITAFGHHHRDVLVNHQQPKPYKHNTRTIHVPLLLLLFSYDMLRSFHLTVTRQRIQVYKWESIQFDCEGEAYSIVYFSIYVLVFSTWQWSNGGDETCRTEIINEIYCSSFVFVWIRLLRTIIARWLIPLE